MSPRIQASSKRAHNLWFGLILTRQSTKWGAVWQQRLHWGMGPCGCSPHWCLCMVRPHHTLSDLPAHSVCLGSFHTQQPSFHLGWVPKPAQSLHFAEEHFLCHRSSWPVSPQSSQRLSRYGWLVSMSPFLLASCAYKTYWRHTVVKYLQNILKCFVL